MGVLDQTGDLNVWIKRGGYVWDEIVEAAQLELLMIRPRRLRMGVKFRCRLAEEQTSSLIEASKDKHN